jgi:glycosyltransferase involved in cell wall biosynthesis
MIKMVEQTFIIPAYNEEKRIFNTLIKLTKYFEKTFKDYEIICIVDGIDNTDKIVNRMIRKNSKIKLLKFTHRLGKGGAIAEGVKKANGKKLMIIDADASIPLKSIPIMINLLEDYDIVSGSRFLNKVKIKSPIHRKLLSKACSFIERKIFNLKVSDPQFGFKAYRTNAIKELVKITTINNGAWDLETMINVQRKGFSIKDFPLDYYYTKHSKVNVFSTTKQILFSILKLKFFQK